MINLEEIIAIEEIKKIKEFAKTKLGLVIDKSFNELDLKGGRTYYWIYASPKNMIYSIFKKRPHKFYESEAQVNKKEKQLKKQGYDTHIFSAECYGSLNGCPTTKGLLNESSARIAFLVLHEGAHEFMANNFKIPHYLSEPIGDYIGFIGGKQFLKKHHPKQLLGLRMFLKEIKELFVFVNKYHNILRDCYENGVGKRSIILRQATNEANKIGGDEIRGEYNNAFFLRWIYYCKYDTLVFNEFKKRPIKKSLENLNKIVESLEKKIGDTELIPYY